MRGAKCGADLAQTSCVDDKRVLVRRINSYRDLLVWQKAMRVAEQCCREAHAFAPRGYVLATHIQKTAIAIPSNIAEGHELQTASFRLHVRVALGSVAELETQLTLAVRLGFLPTESLGRLASELSEIERMLRALRSALSRRLPPPR